MLSEVSSLEHIFTWTTALQLLTLACVALLPGALLRRWAPRRLILEGLECNGMGTRQKNE